MAGLTTRFKLNRFGGGTPGTIVDDGQKYTSLDRDTIDRLLAQVETHDHRFRPVTGGLSEPADAVLTVDAGTLSAGNTYSYRYSVVDAQGTESIASPIVSVTTPALLAVPGMPSVYTNGEAGTLAPGIYYYAVTALRGDEETPLGPAAVISVITGETSVRITMPELGLADSFRLWRMGFSDAGFTKIAVVNTAEYLDDGSVAADPCACDPGNMPPQTNTGVSNYGVTVTLPASVDLTNARAWRLYRSSYATSFPTNSLVHEVVERTDEWDVTTPLVRTWTDVGDPAGTGAPQDSDLNMRFQPLSIESTTTALPDPAAYPDGYPYLLNGLLHVKTGTEWVRVEADDVLPSAETLPSPVGYRANTLFLVGDRLYVKVGAAWEPVRAADYVLTIPFGAALPDPSGVQDHSPFMVGTDLYVLIDGAWEQVSGAGGVATQIMTSPNGTRWQPTVDDTGAIVMVSTLRSGPPSPVLDATVTVAGSDYTVSWSAPTYNGGSPLLGYKAWHETVASFTEVTVPTGATSITITGGTSVVVVAYNELGESAPLQVALS